MPLYSYKCPDCFVKQDIFKRIVDLEQDEPCARCGSSMERQICAPMVRGDYAGYNCPITGDWIEGRRAHEANLKKHGCRILEAGEKESAQRGWQAADDALDKAVEATAEEFVEKLPTIKRERLAAELEGGLDVQVVRQ